MKLFENFDRVYCVNLEKRKDRFENFKLQVEKYDLGEFERFNAIDGSTLNLSNTKLKSGEIGLIKSNLEIIRSAKENNLKNLVIIEDDCVFTNEINNIDSYFQKLPHDWDMLYMGGNHNLHMGVKPPYVINDKVVKLHTTYSTHFVIIKETVFDHIIYLLEKFDSPLDVSYVKLQKIFNVYSFYPAIAKQLVDYSDIQNQITDYNWLIK